MNVVAMIHKTGLRMAETLAPVWRASCGDGGKLIAVPNADCAGPYPWADETFVWPRDPGHHGIEQCRRHAKCVDLASRMEGVTAIVEPDAFLTCAPEVSANTLAGSRLWDALDLGDRKYLARWFLHPPYVANRATWQEIARILSWWLENGLCPDEGYCDRVLCLAASSAGVGLEERGFSRNTIADADVIDLIAALETDTELIHGVKEPRLLGWWLVDKGYMQPNLWTEFGLEPDNRPIPWAMDLRHVNALLAMMRASGPRNLVEIGSHKGHSTTAFLRYVAELPTATLHLVEPSPTPELLGMLAAFPAHERVILHRDPAWELDIDPDFVLIDGNHEWPALADLAWCLSRGTGIIATHDTRSHARGIGGCWGAEIVANILRPARGRVWLEDDATRPNEWTHRGLGVSIRKDLDRAADVKTAFLTANR